MTYRPLRLYAAMALAIASATALPLAVQAQPGPASTVQAEPIITRTEIAPGIYQFQVDDDGYVEKLNSVAIVTDKDVVVFDTNTRPSSARAIIAQIRKITPKPVRYAVNSHWHPDHWSGNQAYAEAFPDLEIIATEQERDFMMNISPGWKTTFPRSLEQVTKQLTDEMTAGKTADGKVLTDADLKRDAVDLAKARDLTTEQMSLTRTFPTLTYTDQLTLHHGGREFRFMSVTGDAAATTVLFLPKEKILITGDVVSYPLPYFTPPLSKHAATIRELARLDADVVIPGHGPAFRDKGFMLMEADLLDEVRRQTVASLRGGKIIMEDVQAAVNVDSFRDRFTNGDSRLNEQWPNYIKRMARRAYLEARDTQEVH